MIMLSKRNQESRACQMRTKGHSVISRRKAKGTFAGRIQFGFGQLTEKRSQ